MSDSIRSWSALSSRRGFLQAGALGLLGTALQTVSADDKPHDVAASIKDLPTLGAAADATDWLIASGKHPAGVYRGADEQHIILTNGLIRRVFRVAPNAGAVAFDNLMPGGGSLLRGVKPEARLRLDGVDCAIGGLKGQANYAYLDSETEAKLTADPLAFRFVGCEVGKTKERFAWKRTAYSPDLPWPPPGASLTLRFAATPELSKLVQVKRSAAGNPAPGSAEVDSFKDVEVAVHYELYDDIPVLAKWFTLHNGGQRDLHLEAFTSEILAVVEGESSVEMPDRWVLPNLHVECDYAFHGMSPASANRAVHWVPDPQYGTQVNYLRQTPCLLECRPPLGPDEVIAPGGEFTSFRTFELVHDGDNRERQGLALRRMYRTLSPWICENPILMHVTNSDPAAVHLAVDQCAEVGFEMLILSFGSGVNLESTDPKYIARIKELVDYANGKGVQLGGYSLLASRSVGPDEDVVNPATGKTGGAIYGSSPCLCSTWGEGYFKAVKNFVAQTGLGVVEHDGSYPGDLCASTKHPGHRGLNDSQWKQWKAVADFYQWCRARGVYLNVPDWYFLSGSTKVGMGYREDDWSLPRAMQVLHGRQNIYDGTWEKTPSMGWMFVPLVQYHGGGEAATIEPLVKHLDVYDAILGQNFGLGVQACYRGPRLYDSGETKAVVKKWVDFYKKYRDILESDLIHIRRADGRDLDCMMHINPRLKHKALAMVFNPLQRKVMKSLTLPLYHTGLTETASLRQQEGPPQTLKLDRKYNVELPVELAPRSATWFVVE